MNQVDVIGALPLIANQPTDSAGCMSLIRELGILAGTVAQTSDVGGFDNPHWARTILEVGCRRIVVG